jgi:hypothetical protein
MAYPPTELQWGLPASGRPGAECDTGYAARTGSHLPPGQFSRSGIQVATNRASRRRPRGGLVRPSSSPRVGVGNDWTSVQTPSTPPPPVSTLSRRPLCGSGRSGGRQNQQECCKLRATQRVAKILLNADGGGGACGVAVQGVPDIKRCSATARHCAPLHVLGQRQPHRPRHHYCRPHHQESRPSLHSRRHRRLLQPCPSPKHWAALR